MERFTTRGATIAYVTIGRSPDSTSLHLIWAHGWGQDHRALVPMARALEPLGTQILLDFPDSAHRRRPLSIGARLIMRTRWRTRLAYCRDACKS